MSVRDNIQDAVMGRSVDEDLFVTRQQMEDRLEDRLNRRERRRRAIEKADVKHLEDPEKVADIEEALWDRGILTGSRAWGIEKDRSDYDYIVPNVVYDYIQKVAGESAVDGSYWFESIRIYVSSKETGIVLKEFNIWPMGDNNAEKWVAVSTGMEALVKSSKLMRDKISEEKEFRIALYEKMRDGLGIEVVRNERDYGPNSANCVEDDIFADMIDQVEDTIPY